MENQIWVIEVNNLENELGKLGEVSFGILKLGELSHNFVKFLPLCKRVS